MAAKFKVGEGPCFSCGRTVVWRKTEGAALSCFCQHCDLQAYAKHGTEAERNIMKAIGAIAPPAEKPKPAEPVPDKPPKDKPPKAAGVFGLGGF